MAADNCRNNRIIPIFKECALCFIITAVLFTMDRCLENMYCFFLYDTGKRYLDLFMSVYLHAHRWFPALIPAFFLIWLFMHQFKVNYGILLPIISVYVMYYLTSLLSGNGCDRWINTTLYPMTMYLFVTVACSTRKGIKRFVFAGTILYSLLLVLNAFFTVFPQFYSFFTSWEPDYFLSADNLTGFPLLCGLFFALLDHHYNANNTRFFIFLLLFILNQALIHCASSLIAALCAGIFYVPYLKKLSVRNNLNCLVLLSAGVCSFLVFNAWLYFHDETVAAFLNPVLFLRNSLYVRFIIWNGVFLLCLKKPLFGYGLGEKAEIFLRPETTLDYNAHNAYLQTIYEGGILTQGAVFYAFWALSRKMKKCNDKNLPGYITSIIFAELIMMQASITSWFTWYPVLLIAQIGALCCIEEDVERE